MMELLIVCFIALLIAALTYKKELLSLGGSVSVFVMLVIIDYFGKWPMVALIIWAYLSLSVIDKIFEKRIENSVDGIHEKSGKRFALQVWVNGGAAVIAIILYGLSGRLSFLIGYVVAIGEAYADSLASDIGVMSKKTSIDICTLKPIQNGLSGGVTLLGSIASIVGVAIYTLLFGIMYNFSLENIVLVFLCPILGCFIDSVMGSRLQIKYVCPICNTITEKRTHCDVSTNKYKGLSWLDNSMVNLISNAMACVIGIVLFEIFIAL